jgi:hypothetical protein
VADIGRKVRQAAFSGMAGGERGLAAEDSLFLNHQATAMDLRMILETQFWDLAGASLRTCEQHLKLPTDCWLRLTIRTHSPYVSISGRDLLQCCVSPDNTIAVMPDVDASRTLNCIRNAISSIEELGGPISFFDEAGDYTGPLDVSFELEPEQATAR